MKMSKEKRRLGDLINEDVRRAPLDPEDASERLLKAAERANNEKAAEVIQNDSMPLLENISAARQSPSPLALNDVHVDPFEKTVGEGKGQPEEELIELSKIAEENKRRFDRIKLAISTQAINLVSTRTGLEIEADGFGEIISLKLESLQFDSTFIRSLEEELVRLINEVDTRAREIEISAREKIGGT
ncbi:hypothetical protein [Actinomadura hibisca]|uniref:hypothetical protein n=1 Tax=Actinomadura hibisca TaxID=68565 RepID=UPI000B123AC6|nr:hypothetical protein [Actinomadura hibisca]